MTNKIEILRELIQTARKTLNAFTTIGVSRVAFDYNKVISSEVLQEYERALSIEIPNRI